MPMILRSTMRQGASYSSASAMATAYGYSSSNEEIRRVNGICLSLSVIHMSHHTANNHASARAWFTCRGRTPRVRYTRAHAPRRNGSRFGGNRRRSAVISARNACASAPPSRYVAPRHDTRITPDELASRFSAWLLLALLQRACRCAKLAAQKNVTAKYANARVLQRLPQRKSVLRSECRVPLYC